VKEKENAHTKAELFFWCVWFFVFIFLCKPGGNTKNNSPESVILSDCLNYLQIRGIYHWRNNTGAVQVRPGQFMRFGKVGSSDILGILPGGRLLCVECKANKGRLSPEQKQFLADARELGALALVVHGWWELDEALREAGYAMKDMPLFENNNALPHGAACK
jgi:hypothetical protein